MSDEELIRATFARIQAEPEASRKALRSRIVRALRLECPTAPPDQAEECDVGEARTLEDRTAAGHEIVARKREEHYQARMRRTLALDRAIRAAVGLEVERFLPTISEGDGEVYWLTLCLDCYAPIRSRWVYREHDGWVADSCYGGLWLVETRPGARLSECRGCDSLDEALAVAQDFYPAHLVLPKPPKGRWERFCDRIALGLGARLFVGPE